MNYSKDEFDEVLEERRALIQKVIDRLVLPDLTLRQKFKKDLEALVQSYPDNERPLDNNVVNMIR